MQQTKEFFFKKTGKFNKTISDQINEWIFKYGEKYRITHISYAATYMGSSATHAIIVYVPKPNKVELKKIEVKKPWYKKFF